MKTDANKSEKETVYFGRQHHNTSLSSNMITKIRKSTKKYVVFTLMDKKHKPFLLSKKGVKLCPFYSKDPYLIKQIKMQMFYNFMFLVIDI
jgi:hypothetical protein